MVIGFLPIVGGIYDVVSLALERDSISGQRLTDAERGPIFAGLLFGGLGFADELFEAGATAARLRNLDAFTAGDRALLRGDDLRRALVAFDEGGALGRRLGHLDEATAFRLSHLDEFTAGDRALLRGDELRRALGGFDEGGGALARRLDAVAVQQAVVPYDIRTAARQYNFPDRVTNAIVENLKPGRYIPIELKDLGGGRLAMKPAAMHLDNLAPYKHIISRQSRAMNSGS